MITLNYECTVRYATISPARKAPIGVLGRKGSLSRSTRAHVCEYEMVAQSIVDAGPGHRRPRALVRELRRKGILASVFKIASALIL